eukprot:10959586-Lingulodinium_polyedra.AAC.1
MACISLQLAPPLGAYPYAVASATRYQYDRGCLGRGVAQDNAPAAANNHGGRLRETSWTRGRTSARN